jgi:hypothetical protein
METGMAGSPEKTFCSFVSRIIYIIMDRYTPIARGVFALVRWIGSNPRIKFWRTCAIVLSYTDDAM